jgi:hypothetical protein
VGIIAGVVAIVSTPIIVVLAYLGPRSKHKHAQTVVNVFLVTGDASPPDLLRRERAWREGDSHKSSNGTPDASPRTRTYDQRGN